jgi:hypothetical protein
MSANMSEFTANDLIVLAPRWDELIAADIVREIERDTVPDMRLALAIKGYREMHEILTAETKGKRGVAALRAMALAFRRYAKERPGLSAATFRSAMVESPEWMEAARALRQLFIKAFQQYGLDEVAAAHAHRILRSLVYGYVTSEMLGAFYLPADNNESFDLAVDVVLRGLPALTPCSHEYRSRSAATPNVIA